MENIERDTLEVDVLFVGAGPASLAGALRLRQLINKHNEEHDNALGEITIAVIEKGREIGSHMISGAVMDIRPLAELLPNYSELGAPLEAEVSEEDVSYLTRRFKIKSPDHPASAQQPRQVRRQFEQARPLARARSSRRRTCMLIPEFPGAELLYDENDRVIGVRTGDKGIGKDGKPKENYQPGADIFAKVTVLGEGARGSLTKKLVEKLGLDEGRNPQVYAVGVKEIWELPKGRVKPGS